MGLRDRLRRRTPVAVPWEPVVHRAVLAGELRWEQPFRWGLLLALDEGDDSDLPADLGDDAVVLAACVAVPVRHAADVELDDDVAHAAGALPQARVEVVLREGSLEGPVDVTGLLRCPSGVLQVGDAQEHHLVQVPPGVHEVQVRREPREHAERVVLALRVLA